MSKTMDDFNRLAQLYRDKAEAGEYCNPYDVREELERVADEIDISEDERESLKDIAHKVGGLFWSM